MKTAILFALVCLFGCSLADITCTRTCKETGNDKISGVTTEAGVTFVFEKDVAFKVVFRGDLAFVSDGKIIILINKSTGVILHIEGTKGKIVKNLTVDIGVIFEAKGQVGASIANIIKASATAELQFTIDFGVLFGYTSKAEIDYTVVFGGNKEAGDIGKASFGVFFGTLVDIAVKKGNGNLTKFTLIAGVVVTSESDYDKAILLGLTFNLISSSTDVEGGFTLVLNVVVKGDAQAISKLIAVLMIKKQLVVSINLTTVVFKEVKIPAILSSTVHVQFVLYEGSFYLTYWNEGSVEKSVTVILTINAKDWKKTELCVINAAINRIVYIKPGGFYLIYSRDQGSYMFFLGADVEFGGEGMTRVEVGVYFSAAVALTKKVAVTTIVEKCVKSSAADVQLYLQGAFGISASASARAYAAFAVFLKTVSSKSYSLLGQVTYSVSSSQCITYCMSKLSLSANVEFGAAASAVITTCAKAASVLESATLTASWSLSVSLAVGITV